MFRVLDLPTIYYLELEVYIYPGGGILRFTSLVFFLFCRFYPVNVRVLNASAGRRAPGKHFNLWTTRGGHRLGHHRRHLGNEHRQCFVSPNKPPLNRVPFLGSLQPLGKRSHPYLVNRRHSSSSRAFGRSPAMFGTPQQQQMFQTPHLTTQMAPVAPLVIPLPDWEIQVSRYKSSF